MSSIYDESPREDKGLPISKLRTAADLQKKVDHLRNSRAKIENQWKINLAFYKGNQYAYFNKASNRIETLPTDDGEKPRYRVRLVSNQILVGSQSLLAKYTKTKPQMFATPGSASDHELKAAQMADRLLEYWWSEFNLEMKMKEALLWGIVAGQGYWKISWDDQAGKPLNFVLDPFGNPIIDKGLQDAFTTSLAQYGIQPQKTTVYVGEIKVEVVSPFDVYLDPVPSTFEECRYAFCRHHLDPDEVKARWGYTGEPDAIATTPDSTLPFGQKDINDSKNVKCVWTGYIKPSPSMPSGRYVVWTDKTILQDGPWPYPFEDLPLVKFPGLRVPGQVYDSSVVEHAIPLQKELNRTLSQLIEYKNLTLKPRVWSPTGSLGQQRITDEPGVIYQYNPQFGMKPEPENPPSLPGYVFEQLADINQRLDNVFSIREVTEGTLPNNVEAAVAIDLLQEMATDRLAPTIQEIEKGVQRAGNIMLKLGQTYYIEPRLLKIRGSGSSVQAKKFTQADIQGDFDVIVEAGSGLPRTRAGRLTRIMQFVQMGIIPIHMAYKYVDTADLKGLTNKFALDEDQASREHDKLNQGQPINPESAQQAFMALQQGINPETGNILTPMDDVMGIIKRASLQPVPAENSQVHMQIHADFMKSPEYESMPPEIKQDYATHYMLTQQKVTMESGQQLGDPPKVSLQLKSTVGPTTQSEILKRTGINLPPEVQAEPPLDTWVMDTKDKPTVDKGAQETDQFVSLGKKFWQETIKQMKTQQKPAANTKPKVK